MPHGIFATQLAFYQRVDGGAYERLDARHHGVDTNHDLSTLTFTGPVVHLLYDVQPSYTAEIALMAVYASYDDGDDKPRTGITKVAYFTGELTIRGDHATLALTHPIRQAICPSLPLTWTSDYKFTVDFPDTL